MEYPPFGAFPDPLDARNADNRRSRPAGPCEGPARAPCGATSVIEVVCRAAHFSPTNYVSSYVMIGNYLEAGH